jgi:SAM-dependent methyltransferase
LSAPDVGRIDGRRAFGGDARNYDDARPEYPPGVFDLLRERCGLAQGTRTFEIGPGTGLATRPLLAAGAGPLVAVEPDARLAAVLQERTASKLLQVIVAPFEEAVLPDASFDLGCSATAFHWLEQRPALTKVAAALRPGGAWAMWWNVFGDPEQPDPFHDATQEILAPLGRNPSQPVSWKHPFALDRQARLDDLQSVAAFEDIAMELFRWTHMLDAPQVRALYATYSHIALLPDAERERVLDGVRDVAAGQFAGRVERKVLTPVYTCRRRAA